MYLALSIFIVGRRFPGAVASLLTDCPGVYSPVVAGVPHSVLAASIFLTDYFGTAKLLLCVGQYNCSPTTRPQ